MSGGGPRWNGHRSEFPWEQAALDHVRGQMPDAEPYRAWQTFMFTTDRGHVREIDLLLVAPAGLFLVEIKSHPGVLTNRGDTWMFRDRRITRTIDNPLSLTDHKAKELKNLLKRAARSCGIAERVPFIRPAVFLSAENLVCRLNEFQRGGVYGRDGIEDQTDLPGIWVGLLDDAPSDDRYRVSPAFSRQLPKLLREIGIANMQRIGTVGPYELEHRSFGAGPTWADYLARNPALPDDQPRRVRVYLTERIDSTGEADSVRRAAYREYMALQGISHEGIVRADDYSEELLAGPAVVFRHGAAWHRLDHFIASGGGLPTEARLDMVRQLAEALDHAHRRHLYHRALAPQSVYVETDGSSPQLRIADWQVASRADRDVADLIPRQVPRYDPDVFLKLLGRSAGAYLAPEFDDAGASAAGLDVFGLGALTYLILAGEPPAADRGRLLRRIETDHALTVSALVPRQREPMSPAIGDLIRSATRENPADRTERVREFMRQLDLIEEELAARSRLEEKDPLTAVRGDAIAGWTVRGVIGKGTTSKSFLVEGEADGTADTRRVFRIALNDAAAERVRREAGLLRSLNDSHVIRILDGPFEAGPPSARRTVIAVEYAEGETLAEELRRHGPLGNRELEGLGDDLLQGVRFLSHRDIWHRDIKPDNLVLRVLPRGGYELVMIDFALSGIGDTDLTVGTPGYLDPFLGGPGRDRFDEAAQLYAVAVTLHDMASAALPEWDDLAADPEPRIATDRFDPALRDPLTSFFRTALHRDPARRFGDLHALTRAWADVFY